VLSSLTGDNQALFVVDVYQLVTGSPIQLVNHRPDQVYDYGNAASDINPDDIESINVFKRRCCYCLVWFTSRNRCDHDHNQKREIRKRTVLVLP